MKLREVLDVCAAKGISLGVQGDQLKVRVAVGGLDDQIASLLRKHKEALIDWLNNDHRNGGEGAFSTISRADRSKPLQASHAQQRLWFVEQVGNTGTAFHIGQAVRLRGALDRSALQATLDTIVERHEALRTSFTNVNGEAMQTIAAQAQFCLQTLDLSALTATACEAEIRHQTEEEASTPFDLSRGPLIRGRLLCVSAMEHVLLVTMHHIVSDGWSMRILFNEVAALYAAYIEGKRNPLAPVTVQYTDFAQWQRQWLRGAVLTKQLDYWKSHLAGAIALELPMDRKLPATHQFAGAVHVSPLTKELATGLQQLASSAGATLYMTLLSVFQILLSRISGQDDIVVTTPIAGRTHPQTERIVGFFVNALLLRGRVEGSESFQDLLTRTKDLTLGAYAHQDLQFDKLVAELRNERAESAKSLARVSFTLRDNSEDRAFELPRLRLEPISQPYTSSKTYLSLTVEQAAGELACTWEYATDLFERSTIENWARRFVRLAEQVVAQPAVRIDDLDLTISIDKLRSHESLPLSSAQRAIWTDLRFHPEKASEYDLSELLDLTGNIDPVLYEQALQQVVDHTAALRLQFDLNDSGDLEQTILPQRVVQFQFLDFQQHDNPRLAADSWLTVARRTLIDPIGEVPCRFALLQLAPDKFCSYIHTHHLVVDGLGLGVLRRRIPETYVRMSRGMKSDLTDDRNDFLEHLHIDGEYRFSAQFLADKRYWKGNASVAEPCTLSVISAPPSHEPPLFPRLPLNAHVALALRECAEQSGIGFGRLVIAAVLLYIAKMNDRWKLPVGLPTHGRFDAVTRQLAAVCANVLPIQFELNPDATIAECARSIGGQLKAALEHARHRYADIRRLCGTGYEGAELFNVTVNVMQFETFAVEGLAARPRTLPHYERDLTVWVYYSRDQSDVVLQLYGNPASYRAWELDSHLQRLQYFMSELAATARSGGRVRELTCLDESERNKVVEKFNASASQESRTELVYELFEKQVELQPQAIALVDQGRELTYSELNSRSNRVARELRRLGVGPDDLVAIHTERGANMIVAMLGIWKAGGAYVPLDPSYPFERLAFMLADAQPKVLLTQGRLMASLPASSATIVVLDDESPELTELDPSNLDRSASGLDGKHLAYVMYTSGSTGSPKGVMVEHGNVLNHNLFVRNEFALSTSDRVLQFATMAFDASVEEIFPTLLAGATLLLRSADVPSAEEFSQLVLRERVTVLNLPTAYWQLWTTAVDADFLNRSELRLVIVGGEKTSVESLRTWRRIAPPRIRWLNTYGPTEATVVCTTYCPDGDAEDLIEVPIGRPIANTQIYILDGQQSPVPIGVAGELYIGGAGVARGYLNRPELTAERFILYSPDSVSNARLYKTGDLGRWLPDGNIEYLGRVDLQVKIRGFRVELGEVESLLCKHSGIRQAVVVAREDAGDKRLVAYLTHNSEPPTTDELRAFVKAALPVYMLPSAFVLMDSFPLTPSGKLNRAMLPAPDLASFVVEQYVPPQGELEEALAAIWRELLHVERVGRQDNFFELGGHSLLIVKLLERLRSMGLHAEMRVVFSSPTLMALANELKSSTASQFDVPPNLIPDECEAITPAMLPLVDLRQDEIDLVVRSVPGGGRNVQDIYPLAPLQEGIFFHHLLNEQGDVYVLPMLMMGESRESVTALLSAIQSVIDRYDTFRTAVLWKDLSRPLQVVYRRARLTVEEIELDAGRDSIVQMKERMAPGRLRIDLQCAPLIRVEIAQSAEDSRWYVLVVQHHIITDHSAFEVIPREIEAYLLGQGSTLSQPVPYRVYVAQALAQARQKDAAAFFRSKLRDISQPTAPFGLLNVRGDGSGIDEAWKRVDGELARRIRRVSRRMNMSAAPLFHAAYALVIAHCSGRDDVVFGSVFLGLPQVINGMQRMLGMFVNTLPLRLSLGHVDVEQLIEHTRRELVELLEYEHASLAEAQRCSGVGGNAPLFSAVLNYRHSAPSSNASNPIAADGQRNILTGGGMGVVTAYERTNYPFTVSVDDLGEGFSINAQTDRRIDADRVTAYVHRAVESLVTALESHPDTPALQLSILPERERDQLLSEFNATATDYPSGQLIHELFEAQVEKSPDAIAVRFEGQALSYRELNGKANQLARHLRTRGVGPDQLVAICVERSVEMVVGLLGVLKAGGAYVPVDPSYPAERVAYMLADAAPRVVLTQETLKSGLPASSAERIALDEGWSEIAQHAEHNLIASEVGVTSRHLAYVIYTSGSTGQPKGVMNEHGGLVNRLLWMQDAYRLTAEDRVLQKTPFSFDVSVWEFFWTLLNGARLVMARPQGHQDPGYLRDVIQTAEITTVHFVPSMLQVFLEQGGVEQCRTLRQVVCSGEELSVKVQNRCLERFPQARLHNLYGPTEAAIDVTYWECGDRTLSRVPIGRPISNTQIYILDSQRQPVPLGVIGEIYIGGAGVARGYLNRPELTAERFINDPFSHSAGARLYKSGDLGRYRADGTIEYLGRNDSQVKIRGFRIELGEIESQLARHPSIHEAVVMAREDVPGEKRLVGYVTHRGDAPSSEALRAHLQAHLPEYMVPSAYVVMESFPLTPNGKLDRKALPAPELGAYSLKQYEAPQGETEQTLATLWQELLHVERVGRHDNFFELGGHSLLAVRVTTEVRRIFDLDISLRTVFDCPTLESFAARVHAIEWAKQSARSGQQATGSNRKRITL